jgi:hypothetical protein
MTRLRYNKISPFKFPVDFSRPFHIYAAVFYIYLCNVHFQLVIPEYLLHLLFNILFLASGEWLALCLNLPLIAYHINRYGHSKSFIFFLKISLFCSFTLTFIFYLSYINFWDSPDVQLHSTSLCTT